MHILSVHFKICTKHHADFQGALCHVRARLHVVDLAMSTFEDPGVLASDWGIRCALSS